MSRVWFSEILVLAYSMKFKPKCINFSYIPTQGKSGQTAFGFMHKEIAVSGAVMCTYACR